jgi:hypothetical protein
MRRDFIALHNSAIETDAWTARGAVRLNSTRIWAEILFGVLTRDAALYSISGWWRHIRLWPKAENINKFKLITLPRAESLHTPITPASTR